MRRSRRRNRAPWVKVDIWEPTWSPEIVGWSVNFYNRNKWRFDSKDRCDPVMTVDDLMQEAYIIFERVRASYPRVIDPRHFMALYKTSIQNDMTDRSRLERKRDATIEDLGEDASSALAGRMDDESGYLAVLLSEMPREVQLLIAGMQRDDVAVALREPYEKDEAGVRSETFGERLCRLIGIDPATRPLQQLRELLA